jgi:hypothetical protein
MSEIILIITVFLLGFFLLEFMERRRRHKSERVKITAQKANNDDRP